MHEMWGTHVQHMCMSIHCMHMSIHCMYMYIQCMYMMDTVQTRLYRFSTTLHFPSGPISLAMPVSLSSVQEPLLLSSPLNNWVNWGYSFWTTVSTCIYPLRMALAGSQLSCSFSRFRVQTCNIHCLAMYKRWHTRMYSFLKKCYRKDYLPEPFLGGIYM